MASNCRKFVEEIFSWIKENAPTIYIFLFEESFEEALVAGYTEECEKFKTKTEFLEWLTADLWNWATEKQYYDCEVDKEWNEACELLKELRNKHKLEDYRDCEWVRQMESVTPCDIVTGIILCEIDEELNALFETFSKRLQRF
jgi:hypothetical protein